MEIKIKILYDHYHHNSYGLHILKKGSICNVQKQTSNGFETTTILGSYVECWEQYHPIYKYGINHYYYNYFVPNEYAEIIKDETTMAQVPYKTGTP